MRLFKQSINICSQNFRKWSTNYRVWIVAILVSIFIHYYTREISVFCTRMNVNVAPWIFPFLYNGKYVKLILFFPLLLLLCDAPFIDENQPYILARSGRKSWNLGQVVYIFFTSVFYFMFSIAVSLLVHIGHMEFTSDWGKVLGTFANTNAGQQLGLKIFVSTKIQFYFSPLQAMWFSFLLAVMVGFFLGLIIYVFNSMTNKRASGVLVASFLLVLDATVSKSPGLMWFSPVSWCNIDLIDIGGTSELPTISYIGTMLTVLILLLLIISFVISKKRAIHVLPPV